ncbi:MULTISPECIES: CheR family methyltransferase [unclassified Burkholderia]|uniref:CheR family methyltransferase n=1 Tax=unclassified Burkholderia TaxID=2613784 RepID=UPI000F5831D9|nr:MULTISPECIES: CheR family methyltransferase [unclassified Burkholderia]RQR46163.1 response regulator [Burkholderia sp. Bp9131]RQR78709.1 response regulator [Burkholderia sp. Bp9015]RQS29955.1 response regulator [Burkholderia sp. Bp8995]RQS48118.1 response regulator [Burkholderia sp. Bp8989]
MSRQEPTHQEQPHSSTPVKSDLPFPVVGIGASAGGTTALQTFFESAPTGMDMAFVVIVHLAPAQVSHMDNVLQHTTGMPVHQVTTTVAIEKNHIYVIAPGMQLEMSDGCLRCSPLSSAEGAALSIDHFFRTLADAHDSRAIGIVLSGTGSDGAAGLSRIKEAGGITLAQTPDDAEYAEMPQHAISTARVDIVLPAAEMPQKLLDLWANARRIEQQTLELTQMQQIGDRPGANDPERALSDILMHLRVRTGHDFRLYKRATVLRRIERRMQVNGQRDMLAYRDFLRTAPDEANALLADMLIGVTQFFRDREAFDFLEREVIAQLFAPESAEEQVRVWVAGCATGEEAYSISLLLARAREASMSSQAIQVFATDIDEAAIVRARTGSYPLSIATDVPAPLLQRYFTREGAHYVIAKAVRERILFAAHSLLRDPPFSHLDLISCRNVLIYLERAVQRQILELFHFALRPNGYLFLGTAESADAADDLFTVVDKKRRIYQARVVTHRAKPVTGFPPLFQVESGGDERSAPQPPMRVPASPAQRNFSYSELHQRALETYSPPSVIIDKESNVVHLSDNAGRFLRHVGGELSSNIMTLVLPDLRLDLRTAIFRALQTGTSVEARRVKWTHEARVSWINMTVRPFHDKVANSEFLLIVFDEVAGRMTEEDQAEASGQDPVLAQLEQELQHSREQLATIIEQYETSVEELKASNEELQAINEELRSTSEELESSKEELQSVNEELTTANAEMQARIEDTAKANDDLHNISSVDVSLQVNEHAEAVLRVADTGSGIEPSLLPHIFDMFQQSRDSNARRAGLGIGLALVRDLVSLHGGAVRAESEGVGRGATFTITLPTHRAVAITSPASGPVAESLHGLHILMVDDDATTVETFKVLLESDGAIVQTATSGEEALSLLDGQIPDLVLSDIGMPGMGGLAFIAKLREAPALRSVTCIALSGFGQEADVKEATNAGFDAHLLKPVALDDLLSVLARSRR